MSRFNLKSKLVKERGGERERGRRNTRESVFDF